MFRINKDNENPVVEGGPIAGGSQMDVDEEEVPASKRPAVRVSGEGERLRFVVERPRDHAKEIMNTFFIEIMKMNISQKNCDQFIDLSIKLLAAHEEMILESLVENPGENVVNAVKETSKALINKFEQISSSTKRIKECQKMPTFVQPREFSVALKWKSKMPADATMPTDDMIQSTSQFIPISETLKAMFSQQEFMKMYLKFNSEVKHQCEEGVFHDFCCGSTFKNHEIFKEPNVIQIQLGT